MKLLKILLGFAIVVCVLSIKIDGKGDALLNFQADFKIAINEDKSFDFEITKYYEKISGPVRSDIEQTFKTKQDALDYIRDTNPDIQVFFGSSSKDLYIGTLKGKELYPLKFRSLALYEWIYYSVVGFEELNDSNLQIAQKINLQLLSNIKLTQQ